MNEAFTSEEQNAIIETEIENKKNPYADADADVLGDGNPTNDKIYLLIDIAFSDEEKELIKDTTVTTADNRWSGEPGGNDTIDKIYLPSIEEMLEPAYGFSSDEEEEETRKVNSSAYVSKGGSPRLDFFGFGAEVYWLRSPGMKKGYPVKIGQLGVGKIPTGDYQEGDSATYYGVRPVMHVDLSDTTMWRYAGKVTPKGVVEPVEEEVLQSPTPIPTTEPAPAPVVEIPKTSDEPQIQTTQIKKPGKPSIKQLKNVKGKKVTVTLTKKISGATGYQVAYATKSSMKKQKVKSFKGSSVTIKGLKKKKSYYFRVRAYKTQSGKISKHFFSFSNCFHYPVSCGRVWSH